MPILVSYKNKTKSTIELKLFQNTNISIKILKIFYRRQYNEEHKIGNCLYPNSPDLRGFVTPIDERILVQEIENSLGGRNLYSSLVAVRSTAGGYRKKLTKLQNHDNM